MPISPDPTAPPASTPSKKGRYHGYHTASPARWQGHAAPAHHPRLPVLQDAPPALARVPVSAPGAGLLVRGVSAPGLCRRVLCMPIEHDDEEGVLANVAQVLLALLVLHPDSGPITVPRHWVVGWYDALAQVLATRRGGQDGPRRGDER